VDLLTKDRQFKLDRTAVRDITRRHPAATPCEIIPETQM
jgi:hypothetical protein